MNILHTKSISITGGESTLHPNFIEIVQIYLHNGFEVCVFKNGFNASILNTLLETTKQYKFRMKVSLDCFEDIHNIIRGSINSYKHTIDSSNLISKYDNISLYICTSVMRNNLPFLSDFKSFVAMNYPNATHTFDLVFPFGDANVCSFNEEEFSTLTSSVPSVFSTRGVVSKKKYRCTGGISQCTIMADGKMKICNAASDEAFYFKHNVYEKGLIRTWMDCGSKIKTFRHEKPHKTLDCLECGNVKDCVKTDCRVQAKAYRGSERRSNPLTCYEIKNRRV